MNAASYIEAGPGLKILPNAVAFTFVATDIHLYVPLRSKAPAHRMPDLPPIYPPPKPAQVTQKNKPINPPHYQPLTTKTK